MEEPKVLHHGDLWAVFVGVNEYDDPEWGDLPHCEKDAADVTSVFMDSARGGYPASNIRLLVSAAKRRADKPTRHNIMQAIKHLAEVVETVDNDDCVLFGFFGHGGEKDGVAYIFPTDGYKANPEDTAIELRWVQETLQNCKARFKILIFDTCRNDVSGRGAQTMSEAFAHALELLGQSEGWAVLSSCKQGEVSHDYDEKQHGAFTYHLLEGLNGAADADRDGLVTAYEASRYASLHTKRWAFKNGVQQNPEWWSKVSRDIVLVRSGDGKEPPSGSDDDGDRRRDRWSKLRSITLRHRGEVAVSMWVDEAGMVSRHEGKLRIDEFVGKLCMRLPWQYRKGSAS
jgi:hypothetical protein